MKLAVALVLAALASLATASEPVTYHNFKAYHVHLQSENEAFYLRDLGRSIPMDFLSGLKKGKDSTVMVGPELAERFTAALEREGISYSLMSSDVQKLLDAAPKMAPHRPLIAGRDHNMDWENFQTTDTIYEWMDHLEATNDDFATEVIGQSYEGTPLRIAKICRGGCGNKPAMFIEGTIHAREWMSPMVVTYMMNELATNAAANEDLLNSLDWYILPVVNPDGYAYTQTNDRMWRKTRSPNEGSVCDGTDANRNFDYAWSEPGASGSPCSDVYYGPSAFSESETAAIRDFVNKHKDNIKFFNDVHAAANMVLLPWGYTYDRTDDYEAQMTFFQKAADALESVYGTKYEVGQIPWLLYESSGCTSDYLYGTVGVKYACAIELRDDYLFWPPPETIVLEGAEVWEFHRQAARDIIAEFVP